MQPKPWTELYPQGTPEGDEEQAFFIALARDTQTWRSTGALAGATGLAKKRIEQIVAKYLPKGVVFQHEKYDDEWAYWERVPDLVPKEAESLVDKDHRDRIEKLREGYESDGIFDKVAKTTHAVKKLFGVPGRHL